MFSAPHPLHISTYTLHFYIASFIFHLAHFIWNLWKLRNLSNINQNTVSTEWDDKSLSNIQDLKCPRWALPRKANPLLMTPRNDRIVNCQPFNLAILQQFNLATYPHCNIAKFQHYNIATLKIATLQHCIETLQHCDLKILKPYNLVTL